MTQPANTLNLSGFAGIGVGMIIGLYQVLLRDPMIFGESMAAPAWLLAAHVHFFGLSLIVLFYALWIDDLFEGWQWPTVALAILGQWGIPVVVMIAHGLSVEPLNALQLPLAIVNIAVLLAFLVNYARRGM